MLLLGAPWSCKTMLARALRDLLPPLTRTEAAGVTALCTLVGQKDEAATPGGQRPCVAPPPEVSRPTLYGGGASRVQLGMMGQARRGLLLFDELPAFRAKLALLPAILDPSQ